MQIENLTYDEIIARIAEIEATDESAATDDLMAEYDALCKAKFDAERTTTCEQARAEFLAMGKRIRAANKGGKGTSLRDAKRAAYSY